MPNYRRAFIPGGTWFFTVNLLQRHNNDLLIREIGSLRETVKRVRDATLFESTPGWFYRTLCTLCGPCRPAMPISVCDGV